MNSIDAAIARLTAMPDQVRAAALKKLDEAMAIQKWVPNPGPQTDAYFSEADVLLYGGAAGGGKSALLIGLGATCHRRSLIVRKTLVEVEGLLDATQKMLGACGELVRGNRPRFTGHDGRLIHYAGFAADGGIGTHQGTDHDLIGVDEAANVPEDQIRLLMGWLRTDRPGQRCRVVLASNPPLDTTGDWMIKYFAPWLDNRHPNPAACGELRYFISNDRDEDQEVTGPEPIQLPGGLTVKPQSRTFTRARVKDNPYYANTDYETKTLGALKGAMKAAFLEGNFLYDRPDSEWQVIPTDWVREAMDRHRDGNRPVDAPMCSMGVDCARGGQDKMTIAMRFDGWFEPIISIAGDQVPDGDTAAGHVIKYRRDGAEVIVDVLGVGSSPVDALRRNIDPALVIAYNGGKKSYARTADKTLKFYNKRAEDHWRLREALDPSQLGGSQISLPDDPELLSDLTSVMIKNPDQMMTQGILLESKEDIKKRIHRSPDKGDAVVMAHSLGKTIASTPGGWPKKGNPQRFKVVLGHQNQRRQTY